MVPQSAGHTTRLAVRRSVFLRIRETPFEPPAILTAMANVIAEAFESVVRWFVRFFLYLTGESLRWLFTLGRRRIRWWDTADYNAAWPSIVLGLAFWMGLGAVVWGALR